MKKIVNLLDTMKDSSNSESESADEIETIEKNTVSGAHNSDGDESVKNESDDGNQLQLFLRGGDKTQVPLRVEVFRIQQK